MDKKRIEKMLKDLNDVVGYHNIAIMKKEGEKDPDKKEMAIACDAIYAITNRLKGLGPSKAKEELEEELEETYSKFNDLRAKLNY